MTEPERSFDDVLLALRERAKEFSCLYRVDEILNRTESPPDELLHELIPVIPAGWQFPDVCGARLEVRNTVYGMDGPPVDSWAMSADIAVHGEPAGAITVFYTERRPKSDEGPFLAEERRLIQAIADRIGLYLLQRRLRMGYQTMETALQSGRTPDRPAWVVMIDFMRRTDPALLERVTRKMVNYLSWSGVSEVRGILQDEPGGGQGAEGGAGDENRPAARRVMRSTLELTQRVFEIAALNIGETELMSSVQGWIQEEKASFLIRTLENMDSNLGNIVEAVERYQSATVEEAELPPAVQMSLRVSLLQRLFTDRLEYINLAKKHVQISDFYDLVQHVVYPPQSQGKLGGKAAGLYVADRILRRHTGQLDSVRADRGSQDLARGLGRRARLHAAQQPRRPLQTEVRGHRANSAGLPAHRPGLQELAHAPGDREGSGGGARRFRGPPAHRAQLEPARGSHRIGVLRQVQESLPGQSGEQAGAARGASGRHRRGLRLDLRSRPHRVSRRARPPRLPRGDGDHDPGGGGPTGGEVLPPRLCRRRLQQQRVPLVGAHSPRGRPAPAGSRAGHPGGGPHRRRLSDPGFPRPAAAAGERLHGRGAAVLSEVRRRDQPRSATRSRPWSCARYCRSAARTTRWCAASSPWSTGTACGRRRCWSRTGTTTSSWSPWTASPTRRSSWPRYAR